MTYFDTYFDTQPCGTLRSRLLSASLRPAGSPSLTPVPGVMNTSPTSPPSLEMNTHSVRRRRTRQRPPPEAGKEEAPADPKIIGTIEDLRALAMESRIRSSSMVADPRLRNTALDSARGNLAGTFVNVFINAGFGNDKLLVEAEEGNSWVYKNKEHGMMSATASLGLSLLWDTSLGLSHVDKYTYSLSKYIKAGALLATDILNSGMRTEADVAKGLVGEYVDNKSVPLKTSAIMGLGLVYAGLLQLLIPHISDDGVTMEIASLATLALGFIFIGSENGEITGTILQTLMEKAERGDTGLDEKWARPARCVGHDHRDTKMTLRQFHHLMDYGEPIIRKSVPLAIDLVSVSNPQLPILDTLSKCSHDNDLAAVLNAIFAMGLIGAGNRQLECADGVDVTAACGLLQQRARLPLYGMDRTGARPYG
ncbi:hypothetical protein DFH08DRAFT_1026700 [Mycena albidolilacea]|uniref:Uncharacterized protein n=1 Tax=Mycena albidolilacea TaxID=1033008 RepID=A0AAD7EJP9_9AGAR|nr:hypothetical protein DFH08DRAFT_1026700 [Mycena albidolilacea]